MKKILTALFTIVSFFSFGQSWSPPSDSLKIIHSQNILAFVKNHLMQKVGNGICSDLIIQAEKQNYDNFQGNEWGYRQYVEVPDSEAIHAGDIVTFDSVTFYNDIPVIDIEDGDTNYISKNIQKHMAIVFAVLNDSVFSYASQNIGCSSGAAVDHYGGQIEVADDSKVIIEYFNFNNWKDGKVRFYRF